MLEGNLQQHRLVDHILLANGPIGIESPASEPIGKMEDWAVLFENSYNNYSSDMFSTGKWQRRQLNSGSSEQFKNQ
jgi:hypothetical protein